MVGLTCIGTQFIFLKRSAPVKPNLKSLGTPHLLAHFRATPAALAVLVLSACGGAGGGRGSDCQSHTSACKYRS